MQPKPHFDFDDRDMLAHDHRLMRESYELHPLDKGRVIRLKEGSLAYAEPKPRSDFNEMIKLANDQRSLRQICEHYLLEKRLASRLKSADTAERKQVYAEVYQELFASLPHHPQHHANFKTGNYIGGQSELLRKLVKPGSVLVEIGAGDARLAVDMASHCAKVVAIDVTDVLFDRIGNPTNVVFSLTDGTHLDLPKASVDFVYSNQLMEHLHPEDAREQLREIHRILKPGGQYFCITPNVATGPHDVSKYFDARATGFHLVEYSFGTLAAEMRGAGFRAAQPLLVRKGGYILTPLPIARGLEMAVRGVEALTGRSYRSVPKIRALLGINMLAVK